MAVHGLNRSTTTSTPDGASSRLILALISVELRPEKIRRLYDDLLTAHGDWIPPLH